MGGFFRWTQLLCFVSLTLTFKNNRLSVLWQGPAISYSGAVEIMVLSGGQVFLVFGILCGFLSVSMIFLVLELAHHKINHFKEWQDTNKNEA